MEARVIETRTFRILSQYSAPKHTSQRAGSLMNAKRTLYH